MKVTIIGAGNMGRGIGTRAVAGGHDVELIDRNPEDARSLADELGSRAAPSDTINGDVVVLALPYEALAGALGDHRGALGGRIVVDIANPADWATMDRVVTPEGSSSAEETARLAPDASVVKAFNTTFATTLVAGGAAGQTLDVLIAGDDERAKQTVASLVESGGMRPIDVGPLKRARRWSRWGCFTSPSRRRSDRGSRARSSSTGETAGGRRRSSPVHRPRSALRA